MYRYSNKSKYILSTCDTRLQQLFNEVIKHVDCTILSGHRNKNEQRLLYIMGRSTHQWPDSKHNTLPSLAIDASWYTNNKPQFNMKDALFFSGIVFGISKTLNIPIRCGSLWDNKTVSDNSFIDAFHFELI